MTAITTTLPPPAAALRVQHLVTDTLLVECLGTWTLYTNIPAIDEVVHQLQITPDIHRLTFATSDLVEWDSAILPFLLKCQTWCVQRQIICDFSTLPAGIQGLLHLATAVPERKGAQRTTRRASFLVRLGNSTTANLSAAQNLLEFMGEITLALANLIRGTARWRRADFWVIVEECGAHALPIISLISFLVGLILAFVGAVQLRQFGAHIYVADLVGIAMAREMGAMMTGIVMAGRTGAAFAAQLGTMMVNEEIDALKTTGLPPMEFLVLPRIVALVLMVPLLCLYADLLGILGGMVIGVGMLDLGMMQYFHETQKALTITMFSLGLIKAALFGCVVAVAGCWRGMQCGRSAAAVGEAATAAVVTGIIWIILTDALLTIIYEVLGV